MFLLKWNDLDKRKTLLILRNKKMNEKQWEKYLCKLINDELFSDDNFQALSAKELPYLSQIRSYKDSKDGYGCNPKDRKQQTYQTDLLIREINDDSWTPRVVIELKVDSVHTHDALIYGKKSSKHKDIHPYLRYGMAIGGHKKKRNTCKTNCKF